MKERCRSIYQLARNRAELTQEQAAELLNVGTRTLAGYEACAPIPNGEIVDKMVEIYEASWLGYEHLRLSTKVGRRCLPEINIEDIAKSVLVLQKESGDVETIKPSMIKIACDGEVEEHEEKEWSEVTKEVFEMAGAALSVVFSK